ncbi:DUF5906 domain-containing protein, partial [Streptomyces gilvus]|uniref:DUF5906 domain-containing protein n=1 Tax=Streptomyces gilvus TaxID=2920937 RepID=UPI001F0F9CC9
MTISVEAMDATGGEPEDFHAVHDDLELTDQERAEMTRIAMSWTVIQRQPEPAELPFDDRGNSVQAELSTEAQTAIAAELLDEAAETDDPLISEEVSEAARILMEQLPVAAHEAMARNAVGFFSAPTLPMQVARELKLRWDLVHYHGSQSVSHSIFWRGEWWDHVGTHYQAVSRKSVEDSLWRVLGDAQYMATVTRRRRDAQGNQVEDEEQVAKPWNPTRTRVQDVVRALESISAVDESVDPGSRLVFPAQSWLPAYADPEAPVQEKLTSLRNTMLNLASGQRHEHDSRYLVTYSLPFEYDPTATCPRWDSFLESLWPGDQGSKDLLQEWFGCVLNGDGRHEKMMFIIGPRRSGKGTIATVLSSLLGRQNVAGPTLNSFTTQFGLAPLIGKPLAVVGDARNSKSTDIHAVTEKLLMIVAGDGIDIDRKNRDSWSGILNTRIMMMANQLLNWKDASG